jgi:hypothetical protein
VSHAKIGDYFTKSRPLRLSVLRPQYPQGQISPPAMRPPTSAKNIDSRPASSAENA